jgi:hypothetical protein
MKKVIASVDVREVSLLFKEKHFVDKKWSVNTTSTTGFASMMPFFSYSRQEETPEE